MDAIGLLVKGSAQDGDPYRGVAQPTGQPVCLPRLRPANAREDLSGSGEGNLGDAMYDTVRAHRSVGWPDGAVAGEAVCAFMCPTDRRVGAQRKEG